MRSLPCRLAVLCGLLMLLLTPLCPTAWAARALSGPEAAALLARPTPDLCILDVRTPREFAAGHLPGARNVDYFGPAFEKDMLSLDRQKTYLVYCRNGIRSESALEFMEEMGFTHAAHVAGGIQSLREAGLPLVTR